jgi:hypothetical protein
MEGGAVGHNIERGPPQPNKFVSPVIGKLTDISFSPKLRILFV